MRKTCESVYLRMTSPSLSTVKPLYGNYIVRDYYILKKAKTNTSPTK